MSNKITKSTFLQEGTLKNQDKDEPVFEPSLGPDYYSKLPAGSKNADAYVITKNISKNLAEFVDFAEEFDTFFELGVLINTLEAEVSDIVNQIREIIEDSLFGRRESMKGASLEKDLQELINALLKIVSHSNLPSDKKAEIISKLEAMPSMLTSKIREYKELYNSRKLSAEQLSKLLHLETQQMEEIMSFGKQAYTQLAYDLAEVTHNSILAIPMKMSKIWLYIPQKVKHGVDRQTLKKAQTDLDKLVKEWVKENKKTEIVEALRSVNTQLAEIISNMIDAYAIGSEQIVAPRIYPVKKDSPEKVRQVMDTLNIQNKDDIVEGVKDSLVGFFNKIKQKLASIYNNIISFVKVAKYAFKSLKFITKVSKGTIDSNDLVNELLDTFDLKDKISGDSLVQATEEASNSINIFANQINKVGEMLQYMKDNDGELPEGGEDFLNSFFDSPLFANTGEGNAVEDLRNAARRVRERGENINRSFLDLTSDEIEGDTVYKVVDDKGNVQEFQTRDISELENMDWD